MLLLFFRVSRGRDEVSYIFIVNLEEANSDCVLSLFLLVDKQVEDLLHRIVHDAWKSFVPQHRVGFASSSSAVGENGRVVAVQNAFAEKLCGVLEDFDRCGSLIICIVECKLLLASSVLAKLVALIFLGKISGVG